MIECSEECYRYLNTFSAPQGQCLQCSRLKKEFVIFVWLVVWIFFAKMLSMRTTRGRQCLSSMGLTVLVGADPSCLPAEPIPAILILCQPAITVQNRATNLIFFRLIPAASTYWRFN